MYPEVAAVHRTVHDIPSAIRSPNELSTIGLALEADMDGYFAGLAWRRRMRAEAAIALKVCDVLITAWVASLGKVIGEDTVDVGEAVRYRVALSCFSLWSTRWVWHLASSGNPWDAATSVQLIGAMWSAPRSSRSGPAWRRWESPQAPPPPEWA